MKEEIRHQAQKETAQQPPSWAMNLLGKVAQETNWSRYNNTLQWVIRVHMRLKGWIDYIDEYRIDVLPEGTAS